MNTGQLLAGRYRVVSELTDAGQRPVWRARDEWSDRPVILIEVLGAVPTRTDEADVEADVRARVGREVALAAGVRTDRLAVVTDVAVSAGRLWVVSEAAPARTLREALRRRGVGSIDIMRWGRDVADGLATAHGAGLVHRDVHASMVLLDDDGSARLAGLAATPRFRGGGGPFHPAPEIAAGEEPSPASDVFAWAAMLRCALTSAGEDAPPHGARSVDRRAFEEVLAHAMHPDPAQRPDATTVSHEVARALAAQPVAAAPTLLMRRREARPAGPLMAPPTPLPPGGGPGRWREPPHRHGSGPVPPPRAPGDLPRPPTPIWDAPPAGLGPSGPGYACPGQAAVPGAVTSPMERGGLIGRHRAALVSAAVIIALAMVAGLALATRTVLSTAPSQPRTAATALPSPSVPGSLIGDPRTADPCSLLALDAVQSTGKAVVIPDFMAPGACALGITVNPGALYVSAEFVAAYPSDPPGTPEQVGELRVFRQRAAGNSCGRTIVMPDRQRVYVAASSVQGTPADLCRLADSGTTTAVRTLSSRAVGRRATTAPPNALTTVDLCSVFVPATLAPVSGLNTSLRAPGFNGWSCEWGHNPAFPAAPRVHAATALGLPSDERTTSIAGRAAVIRPNYLTGYPQSCTVDLFHRSYTAENGTTRIELLRLSVYAGAQPNTDLACKEATAAATAVAPRLPSAS